MQEQAEILSWVQPKYRVGEVVYTAGTKSEWLEIACPDCAGTKKWKVITGAGLEFDIACQRCHDRANSALPPYQVYHTIPKVEKATIASIEARQGKKPGDASVSYRTQGYEHWTEERIFHTEDEAFAVAKERADKENSDREKRDDQRHSKWLSTQDLRSALASRVEADYRREKHNYERAVQAIIDMKDAYISDLHSARDDDRRQELIARHLLSEIDEPAPDEWGEM